MDLQHCCKFFYVHLEKMICLNFDIGKSFLQQYICHMFWGFHLVAKYTIDTFMPYLLWDLQKNLLHFDGVQNLL